MHINKKWLQKKTARQELAEQRTGWNQISIHDRAAMEKGMAAMHAAINARNIKLKLGRPLLTGHDTMLAIHCAHEKYVTFRGDTSRYRPHQGEKEKLRRRNLAAATAA